MIDDKQDIINVLVAFFTEECEWEKLCDHNLINDSERKQIIDNIFNKYCIPKERKYSDLANRSYGYDGIYNYNPATENIESINIIRNKAVVTTISKEPFSESFQYILRKTQKGWLIDSKKIYSAWEQKWKRAIL